MIQWVRKNPWPALGGISAFLLLFSLLVDATVLSITWQGALVSVFIAGSVLFTRDFPWVSAGLLAIGFLVASFFTDGVQSALLFSGVSLYFIALRENLWLKLTASATVLVGGFFSFLVALLELFADFPSELAVFRALQPEIAGSILIAVFWLVYVASLLLLATYHDVIGFGWDGKKRIPQQDLELLNLRTRFLELEAKLQLAVEQSDVIVRKNSATISILDGGRFATRADAEAGARALSRGLESAQSTQDEIRRLRDLVDQELGLQVETPTLDDLEALAVLYRRLGYNVTLRVEGEPHRLDAGAETSIYRIIQEAFANVSQHVAVGSSVDMSLMWVDNGFQVIIKDNGIEWLNRDANGNLINTEGYNEQQDLETLVTPPTGAGITRMSERAKLYGGRVDARVVPGVGFTLSLIFPDLTLISEQRAAQD